MPAVERILWFDHGFAKAQVRDDTLVLSDLRMGSEPDYSFNFAVAREKNGKWMAPIRRGNRSSNGRCAAAGRPVEPDLAPAARRHLIQNAIARACTKA